MNPSKRTTMLASLLMVALLLANSLALAGGNKLFLSATAQVASNSMQNVTVAIGTSADSHERKFFGEGALQVIIADRNTDNNDDDTITVRINADSGQSNGSDESTFVIPNTHPGSQRFEFFLVHASSQYADGIANDGTQLDTRNAEGIDDPADGFQGIGAPIIRFGVDAGSGVELDTDGELYQKMTLEIQYDDREVKISYAESNAQLSTDREVYGTDNFVYLRINDQDANLNPTQRDLFNMTLDQVASAFDFSGANLVDDVVFDESADNSAIFEAKLQLAAGDSVNNNPPELVYNSKSVSISLNDLVIYANAMAEKNEPSGTSDVNFVIDDKDGILDESGTLGFGTELTLSLRDNDQNKDSENDETLNNVVTVKVGRGDIDGDEFFDAGEADQEIISMEETDDNTGVFIIDGLNNELKITFLSDSANPTPNNGILELRKIDMDSEISIAYKDPLDENSASTITSGFNKKPDFSTGILALPDSAGLNDKFFMTINDQDLNDNPRTRDAYTFDLQGNSGTYPLKRGGASISNLATLEMEIGGRAPSFASALSITMVETDKNTGIFNATLDLRDILSSSRIDADDGDRLKMSYNDLMGRTSRESSDTLTIQRASTDVDFSRTVLPIPPEDDLSDAAPESSVGGIVGNRVKTTLLVTDVRENTQPNSENSLAFKFRNDVGNPRPAFLLKVEGDHISETIDTMAKYNGSDPSGELGNTGAFLMDIMPELPTLRETDISTGIFDAELEFVNDGALEQNEWDNLKIIFTYYNDISDSKSSGITFRSSDGVVTTDLSSVQTGDSLTITVQDEDLNLDDSQEEEFRSSLDTKGIFIVSIEPEDDKLDRKAVSSKAFRETGEDTGVFTASFLIGIDIPVSEDEDGRGKLNQASVIHITYNDELDSTGDSEEFELDIQVVTSRASIQIIPEADVGPGTKLRVLIVDKDLDLNPRGTDKFEGDDEGDGVVIFRSDRRDAGIASPDLEETGPNTGVFQFDLQLVPIKGGEDGEPIEVEGGSNPRIGVLPGNLIAIKYEDENDGEGRRTVVSRVIDIRSWEPTFTPHRDSYDENDVVTMTINDPDANRNPDIAEILKDMRISSTSDRFGRTYSAIETGKDTGIFRLIFSLTTGTQRSAVNAHLGDELTVEYEDDFPADYADRAKHSDHPEKKNFFTLIIGESRLGTGATTPLPPTARDVSNNEVSEVLSGKQVILSTSVKNNNARSQPFVGIIEVRDNDQVTQSLAWQTGVLNPESSANMGISWTPAKVGSYQIRTFVISDLEHPEILSPIAISEVKVT